MTPDHPRIAFLMEKARSKEPVDCSLRWGAP
jgi:hypothetical protein